MRTNTVGGTAERYEAFQETAAKVARFTSKRYPNIDWEDVFQDLMIEAMYNDKIDLPDDPDSNAFMALRNHAQRVVREMRAENLRRSVQYDYSLDDVKKILEDSLEKDEWERGWVPEDAADDHQDSVAMRADIFWGYDLLHDNYKAALWSRYVLADIPSPGSPEKQRLRRALDRLMQILNGYSRGHQSGPGRRTVMTNARANYDIDQQENY